MTKKKSHQVAKKDDQWISCSTCKKEIRPRYLATHNQKEHSDKPFISKFAKQHRKNEGTKARAKRPVAPTERRIIISGRGTVVYGTYKCNFCPEVVNSGWRYKSSVGPLILCGTCKSTHLVAPYGIGMPRPRVVVTNFETNRRRH